MAPEPLIFETGSKIFDVTDLNCIKQIGRFNCILSERFTVGGYDWVIEFYPLGINELVPKDVASVAVRVLNPMEEFQVTCSFSLWLSSLSTWWDNSSSISELVTFSSSGTKARCRWSYDNFISLAPIDLAAGVAKDGVLRFKCFLCVTPRPPAPAPPLKPHVDKPFGTNNQGNLSGANSSFNNGFHTADYAPPNGPNNTKLPRQPTVRIYCQANDELSVTARNGTVVLAPANPNDHYQHWIKDISYGDKIKDALGSPAFALVNRVTGQALKNPAGENQEVTLVPYNPNRLEDSVKWTEAYSTGFRTIRIADTTSLNLTALGTILSFPDGAKIVVQLNSVNAAVQRWKIIPY